MIYPVDGDTVVGQPTQRALLRFRRQSATIVVQLVYLHNITMPQRMHIASQNPEPSRFYDTLHYRTPQGPISIFEAFYFINGGASFDNVRPFLKI